MRLRQKQKVQAIAESSSQRDLGLGQGVFTPAAKGDKTSEEKCDGRTCEEEWQKVPGSAPGNRRGSGHPPRTGENQPELSILEDNLWTFVLISPLVVSFWRGGWELMDVVFYPGADGQLQNQQPILSTCPSVTVPRSKARSAAPQHRSKPAAGPQQDRAGLPSPFAGDHVASAWASLVFGMAVVTALKLLEPKLARRENELADALQERAFTFSLALGGIGIWHGVWCAAPPRNSPAGGALAWL